MGQHPKDGQVFFPFVFETYQTLPRLLCIDDEAGGGVPRYPGSGHQHVLASVTLHKTMAEGILARAGRLDSGPFHDESSWEGVMESQSYQR